MSINVGSDFSGVGAFNQALKRLGIQYNEVFACDKDEYARQTFILNYGRPASFPTNVYKRKIPAEPLDIYMTSPPCQAFSKSGNRQGKKDKRGILFFNSYEFIQKNKPRYFIFENVKGLLSDDNENTFKEWLNHLGGKSINGLPVLFPFKNSVPYHIYYKVLNAKDYNVPQNRERVFIVGIRDDQDNIFTWPKKMYLQKKLIDILQDDLKDEYNLSQKAIDSIKVLDPGKQFYVRSGNSRGFDIANNGDSFIISQPRSKTLRGRVGKQVAQTLDTGNNQGVFYNNVLRRLTPKECFRLMDFDDNFKFDVSKSQAYKQAGNSIVVKCLELIIQKLKL